MGANQNLKLSLRTDQRLALLGRLRMAQWIEMPERDFARQIRDIEQDPLFKKLFYGSAQAQGAIRRQGWPRGRLSGSFYEIDEARLAGGERVQVESKLEARAALVSKIQKIGQEAFERYFLRGEGLSGEEIARRTQMSSEDVQAVNDLLLEIDAEAQSAPRGAEPGPARGSSCLAQVFLEDGEPRYEFFSPHWARGVYQIRYDLIEDWKKRKLLDGQERKRLRHLLKRMEIVNLRQNTLFRILETVTKLHGDYMRSRREDQKRPISLRMLARRLDLAPSTVSRALSGRSLRLPWGREVPLIELVPGRRNVLREVMARWLEAGEATGTDAQLRNRLKKEYSIQVSRRTVNAVRNEVLRRLGKD